MELIPILIILGLVSGLLSGLLGIGGGIITVPALYYLLLWKGYPETGIMQIAVATSLAAIVVTTSIATWVHFRSGKSFLLPVLGYLIPGLIIGCISGAEHAKQLSGFFLREAFGAIAICIGIYFSIPNVHIPQIATRPNGFLTLFGLIIGYLSSLLGIGGGIFTIPVLLAYHIPAPKTVATSSAATLTTSLIGTITYLVLSAQSPPLSPHSFGFIDLPALLCIAIGSLCTTAYGVKLSKILPAAHIKQIFGLILSLTGLIMLLR